MRNYNSAAIGNLELEKALISLESSIDAPITTGNIYFVIPASNGNSTQFNKYYQKTYENGQPMVHLTLASALSACTSNQGDKIYIAPGYAQTISGAAGVSITKDGVSIIALGNGSKRATFTFSTAIAASFNISAADVAIVNCRFVANVDAITAMVNVTGADVSFLSCEFITNTATLGAVLGILTAATATRFRVEGCNFTGAATNSGTTTTAQIKHEVGVDYIIRNNYFQGKMTQAILNATAVLRGLIDNNRFVVATGTVAITMHASSTPFISNNRMNVASGTAPIVAAAGFVAGNVYSAAAGVTAGTASTI